MKRTFAYLGAVLPLTTSAAKPTAALTGDTAEDVSQSTPSSREPQPEDTPEDTPSADPGGRGGAKRESESERGNHAASESEAAATESESNTGKHASAGAHAPGNAAANSANATLEAEVLADQIASGVSHGGAPTGSASFGGGGGRPASTSNNPDDENAAPVSDVHSSDDTGEQNSPDPPAGTGEPSPDASEAQTNAPPWSPSDQDGQPEQTSQSGPQSDADQSDPAQQDPAHSEPAQSDPAAFDPVETDPVMGDLEMSDPVSNEAELSDADSMVILLGGNAISDGPNASTSGDIDLEIVDYGSVTIGYGVATFTAEYEGEATNDTAAAPFADASTAAEVYGADFVLTKTIDLDFEHAYGDTVIGMDTSTTFVIAIDFEDDTLSEGDPGALATLIPTEFTCLLPQDYFAFFNNDDDNVSIDGNTADANLILMSNDAQSDGMLIAGDVGAIEDTQSSTNILAGDENGRLSIQTNAVGIDTIASADAAMLVEDDHFSSLDASVIVGA